MGGSMTKVLHGLYVGGLENSKDAEELIANGISHILVVQNVKYEIEKSPSVQYLQIVIPEGDNRSLFRRVSDSNDFIHKARSEAGNVLVCSESGISANITLVAAYLMSLYELDRQSALGVVRGLKHAAQPVAELLMQLDQFDDLSSPAAGDSASLQHYAPLVSQPESPTVQPKGVTSGSEHARLLEKFGPWSRLEEDMHLIQDALNCHKSLTELDFVPYESAAQSVGGSSFTFENDNQHAKPHPVYCRLSSDVKWTPPTTPPSTPISSSIPRREHVPVPLEAITEISRAHEYATQLGQDVESLQKEDVRTPTAVVAQEPDIFSLDPCDDPLSTFPKLEEPPWSVQTGEAHDPDDNIAVEEVGLELRADQLDDNEEEDDDVPGAIAMPVSDNRISLAQSHRHRTAVSYHPRSLFGTSEDRPITTTTARSFVSSGLFQSN